MYLVHDRAAHAGTSAYADSANGLAALDVSALLTSAHSTDQRELDNAFRQVQHAYYKPIVAQTLVTGEQREIVKYLKSKHIVSPTVPLGVASGEESHDLALINKSLEDAQDRYAKGDAGTNAELTQSAIRGMLDALGDPYTTYLSAREINALEESLKGGDFGGIGVYIVQDPRTRAILVEPIEGTPAYKAGIKTGDQIVRVDGIPVASVHLDEVERKIRGPIGTSVALVVRSRNALTTRSVTVTRQQILVPSVHARLEDGFEYVRLADFGSTSYDEVRKAFLDGKAHNAKGYILDLRNNGGGLLEAAVQISSLFIPQGTIVSTIDRAGNRDSKDALHTSIDSTPLVLLVNKFTASASEITAGAVQDYKVGTLIGTKTFGKGVVQSIYNLSDGGALKITTARYLTPLGRDIHHKGIMPDLAVPQTVEAPIIDTKLDVQLAAAKAYLRRAAHKNGST